MRKYFAFMALGAALIAAACTRQVPPPQAGGNDNDQAAVSPTPDVRAAKTVVQILNLRSKALAGQPLEVTWQVKPEDGATGTISHTAFHYDIISHPGVLGQDVTPAAAGYKELTPDFAQGEFQVPRSFSAKLTPQAGKLYVRAHTIIEGKQYWTDEAVVEVVSDPAMMGEGGDQDDETVSGEVKTVTMTAETWEFEPSTIRVKRGDRVKLVVKSVDVTHGLMLPQYKIDEKLEPGKTVTVEFTADTAGEFPFWCNVPCGEGHREMRGTLIVEE